MSVYVVAQLRTRDAGRYQRCVSAFMDVLRAHDGRLLGAQDDPDVVEGDWPWWVTSSEYRAIARDRRAATDAVVLVIDGLS